MGDISRISNCLLLFITVTGLGIFQPTEAKYFWIKPLGDLLGYYNILLSFESHLPTSKTSCLCYVTQTRSRLITVEKSLISNHLYQKQERK